MYNHNKAQQSKNRVHISWDILYITSMEYEYETTVKFLWTFHRPDASFLSFTKSMVAYHY